MNLDMLTTHYGKQIVVDTNILVLAVVGRIDKTRVPRLRCTEQFTSDDYMLLETVLARFSRLVVTPQILTETSNWIGISFPQNDWAVAFSSFRITIEGCNERSTPSNDLAQHQFFERIGLTDASILSLDRSYLVLTDDFKLKSFLEHLGRQVLNFNQLRDAFT